MRCTDHPLDLSSMRAGDMIAWRRRPLRLTSDAVCEGGEWSASGAWEGYAVRVTQAEGDELLVWHTTKVQSLYKTS